MALDLETTYPANVDPATPDYPFGVPRNVSAPSAGDGTPWEQAIVRDLYGFLAAMLQDATPPIVPTNTADTAQASQYLDALRSILLQRSELVENGGAIVTVGQRLVAGQIYGLRTTRDSGVLVTVLPGGARNTADTIDIDLTASLQKDISAGWVQGAGGGRPLSVPLVASTWYRLFLVMKPDGTGVDVVWDTSTTAANFFANEGAGAGYSDATLYRRIGWTFVGAGSTVLDYYQTEDDPRETMWVDVVSQNAGVMGDGARAAATMPQIPPNTLGTFVGKVSATLESANGYMVFTQQEQADVIPSIGSGNVALSIKYGFTTDGQDGDACQWFRLKVNGASQIYTRRNNPADGGSCNVDQLGWRDDCVIP